MRSWELLKKNNPLLKLWMQTYWSWNVIHSFFSPKEKLLEKIIDSASLRHMFLRSLWSEFLESTMYGFLISMLQKGTISVTSKSLEKISLLKKIFSISALQKLNLSILSPPTLWSRKWKVLIVPTISSSKILIWLSINNARNS